jgi:DNA mismatch repair protein MutS
MSKHFHLPGPPYQRPSARRLQLLIYWRKFMTLMQQYHDAKSRHPGMLLLFRLGDYFELFDEDAETAARVLGLTLSTRVGKSARGTVSMAGFPHQALEGHLRQLLQAGHRVAICEQVEDVRPEEAAEKTQPTLFDHIEE